MKHLSVILLVPALCGILSADQSNFDNAPGASWTIFDPIQKGDIDYSDNTCRMTCDRYSLAELQQLVADYGDGIIPAVAPRIFLFAPTSFADTCVSVDLIDWTPTTNRSADGQYHVLFTRIQPAIGPGTVSGYGMAMIDRGDGNAELEIDIIFNEALFEVAIMSFPYDQETTYRLLFSSRGNVHTARVFDLASPSAPVAELQYTDEDDNFPTGRTGFGVLTDRYTSPDYYAPPDATFDNFLTWDAKPCPVAIEPGDTPGTLVLSSDLYRSMGTDLEAATDPAAAWQSATPVSSEVAGGQLRLVFNVDQPSRFFRRKNL